MDLPSLEGAVQAYYGCGIAESTTRTYNSAKRRYIEFCIQFGLTPFPASEAVLCLFVSFLAKQGLQYQSIRAYISATRHLYISQGQSDPFAGNNFPRLQYVLKGIWRSHPQARSNRRLPITPAILAGLRSVWSQEECPIEAHMLWAASCLGFFAFLRAGEFTSTGQQDMTIALTPEDVSVDNRASPTFLRIFLRKSKTDPFGNGIALFVGRTYQPICPVTAVLAFLAQRPQTQGPLFVHADGSPLTRSQLIQKVRRALRRLGLEVHNYSGHSFRIGAATTAAAVGVPEATIKMLGRWESAAYLRYIRTPREQLIPISSTLLSQSSNQPATQQLQSHSSTQYTT